MNVRWTRRGTDCFSGALSEAGAREKIVWVDFRNALIQMRDWCASGSCVRSGTVKPTDATQKAK
jgi:hypothetical protein